MPAVQQLHGSPSGIRYLPVLRRTLVLARSPHSITVYAAAIVRLGWAGVNGARAAEMDQGAALIAGSTPGPPERENYCRVNR